jgi:hypothetical protein
VEDPEDPLSSGEAHFSIPRADRYRFEEESPSNASTNMYGELLSQNEGVSTPTSSNGPATTIIDLPSFPCRHCGLTFRKAYERK